VLNGPATRPNTPLAVENSVGKPAAMPRYGAKCRHGKESLANSHPPFGPCPGLLGRGLLVFGIVLVLVLVVFSNVLKILRILLSLLIVILIFFQILNSNSLKGGAPYSFVLLYRGRKSLARGSASGGFLV